MKVQSYLCFIGILLPIVAGMFSCAYENEEDLFGSNTCQPQMVTYSQVIEPILTNNCTLLFCHDCSDPAIPDWTVFHNVQANAQEIKEHTGNRTMPPSNSGKILTAGEIDDIACWVDNGAQNN
jgi:hypothetical protein